MLAEIALPKYLLSTPISVVCKHSAGFSSVITADLPRAGIPFAVFPGVKPRQLNLSPFSARFHSKSGAWSRSAAPSRWGTKLQEGNLWKHDPK